MTVDVVIEAGRKRVFACALEWPGWARSGRTEAAALDALLAYAPRYARALGAAGSRFRPPPGLNAFTVAERLTGNATTDFGAPDIPSAAEAAAITKSDAGRLQAILEACWDTFARTVEGAGAAPLLTGPRGGGRTTARIVEHVLESHAAYLRMVSWRGSFDQPQDLPDSLRAPKHADAQVLALAAAGQTPEAGPRGGARWTVRYFLRRAAWHILDHAWEIEDRLTTAPAPSRTAP
jgi:hypothetical protein